MRIGEKAPAVARDSFDVRREDKLVGHVRRQTEAVQDIESAYDEAWMLDPEWPPGFRTQGPHSSPARTGRRLYLVP